MQRIQRNINNKIIVQFTKNKYKCQINIQKYLLTVIE